MSTIIQVPGQFNAYEYDTPLANVSDLHDDSNGKDQPLANTLAEKVVKEAGKGLSTNDYTTAEKNKLTGIATGAEVNQFAFTKVKVGNITLQADSKTATLTLKQAGRAGLTANTSDNSVTISASGEGGSAGTLNTDNTSPQTISSSESLGGAVSLHKISKTGNYKDLNDKPTVLEDKEYEAGTSTGMGKKTIPMNKKEGMNILTQSMLPDSNTTYVITNDYIIGDEGSADLRSGAISMQIGGVNYYCKEVGLDANETILLTTTGSAKIIIRNGGVWELCPYNYYTALSDTSVRVGAVPTSQTSIVNYITTNGTIEVPSGCILEFDGGSITGTGTLIGNNTDIKAGLVKIFDPAITIEGTWNVPEAYPEWFGAGLGNIVGYNDGGVALTDDTVAIQAAVTAFDYVKLSKKYLISTVDPT